MLNHYTMEQEMKTVPFVIIHQEEVPIGYPNSGLYRYLVLPNVGGNCPDCGMWTTTIHEYHPKCVTGGTHNGTPIYDNFLHRRLKCRNCPRTFMEPIPWLKPYQQLTEPGRIAMLHSAANGTFQAVGSSFGRSGQNIKVHVRKHFHENGPNQLNKQPTPTYLGIDEISLAKGKHSYRLVIYNLSTPWRAELVCIHENRKKEDLIKILKEFDHPHRITAIAIDMWKHYKSAIEEALPHTLIVVDAFHVIQASTGVLEKVRKQAQSRLGREQSKALKQDKELFAKPLEELTEEEKERLKNWQETVPELATAISLHQKLRSLYRCKDFEEGLNLLADWEGDVLESGLEPFRELLGTIWNWLPEIMNRFICKISNAKTEGKNNQLRAMNKQGFGYSAESLRARMFLKEQDKAQDSWRKHQDKIAGKLEQLA